MSDVKAQREVLFFLPYIALKFPDFEKVKRIVSYSLDFLKNEKLHAGIARCLYDAYANLGAVPANFPLFCSSKDGVCNDGFFGFAKFCSSKFCSSKDGIFGSGFGCAVTVRLRE